MESRKARIRPAQPGVSCMSDRAAGVPEEVMKVADLIPPEYRAAVLMRRVLAFRLQCWTSSAGVELQTNLAEPSASSDCSVEERLDVPSDGVWNFGLPCKGLRVCSPHCDLCVPGKKRGESPGCPARKKRGLLVARGATQLSCHLNVLGNGECNSASAASRHAQLGRGSSPV